MRTEGRGRAFWDVRRAAEFDRCPDERMLHAWHGDKSIRREGLWHKQGGQSRGVTIYTSVACCNPQGSNIARVQRCCC